MIYYLEWQVKISQGTLDFLESMFNSKPMNFALPKKQKAFSKVFSNETSKTIFLSFLISFLPILAEDTSISWGDELGSLDWKKANEKCIANNMRLPTKKELLSLYKTREFKKWSGNWYWTADELDTERAWAVVLNVGTIVHIPKQYHNHVRCIR